MTRQCLERKTKEELIEKVLELQERNKVLGDKYSDLYYSKREDGKRHQETLKNYELKIDELFQRFAQSEVTKEEYKKVADLRLGNSFDVNATWIDKIVFILKDTGRPMRSPEIVEYLLKNDVTFRTLTDPAKGLSTHISNALKYGRIIGEKQKGRKGYLLRLPDEGTNISNKKTW